MPRADVTNELAETIRSIRLQNKIASRDLAKHINKSPAYISRLENGSILSIDTKVLYSILQFITIEDADLEKADEIYRSLNIKYSAKEIEEQIWFKNFETVECLIPVPTELINEINNTLKDLHYSRQELLSRINSNEALTEEERNDSSLPFNQWQIRKESEGKASIIRIHLSEDYINNLLDSKILQSPYVFVFAIVYYLKKIERFGETVSISSEENGELMDEATASLNEHKFFSISEKNALVSHSKSKEELLQILTQFDKNNIGIINDILSGFRFASNHNIADTNAKLDMFRQNMHWDLGFMLKLVSLDYRSLEDTSVSTKRKLLEDIQELLNQYRNSINHGLKIEDY